MVWCRRVLAETNISISLAKSESMPEIERDFKPWIQRMQQVRQEHGLSAADTVPVFHSTDSYGKRRKKLTQFYVKHFQTLQITSAHATPKANADGTRLLGDFQSPVAAMVTVTADPQHDLFALRRVTRTVPRHIVAFPLSNTNMASREDLI